MTVAAMAAATATAMFVWRRRRPDSVKRSTRLPECAAVFVVCYLGVLVASRFAWDAGTDLDGRRLVPIAVPLLMLVLPGVHHAWVSTRLRHVTARRGVLLAVTVTVVVFGGLTVPAAYTWLSMTHAEGNGYTSREWRESELLKAVKALPQGSFLVSNGNDVVATFSGHLSARLPSRINPTTLQPAPDHSERMAQLRRELRERRGFVAYFRSLTRSRWYLPSSSDLQAEWNLQPLHEYEDGTLYRVIE
jgi:hypothetical protein